MIGQLSTLKYKIKKNRCFLFQMLGQAAVEEYSELAQCKFILSEFSEYFKINLD